MVVEPSGGTSLAAALQLDQHLGEAAAAPLRRIGVIVCGGNVDIDSAPWIQPPASPEPDDPHARAVGSVAF